MADNRPVVIDNPPATSKINWAQIISFVFGLLATLGVAIPDEYRETVIQFLVLATPVITFILRTWFTGKPATVPQMTAAIEDKGHQVEVKPLKPERHVYKRSEDGGRR